MSDFDYSKLSEPEFFEENRLSAHSDHMTSATRREAGGEKFPETEPERAVEIHIQFDSGSGSGKFSGYVGGLPYLGRYPCTRSS